MSKKSLSIDFDELYKFYCDFIAGENIIPIKVFSGILERLIIDALSSFKLYIDDSDAPDISWDNPFITLKYPVKEMSWLPNITLPKTHYQKDILEIERVNNLSSSHFLDADIISVFRTLCGDIAAFEDGISKKPSFMFPLGLEKHLNPHKNAYYLDGIYFPNFYFYIHLNKRFENVQTGRRNKSDIELSLFFNPLFILSKLKESYYTIEISVSVNGLQPMLWSEKDKSRFRRDVFKTVRKEGLPDKPSLWESMLPEPILLPRDITSPHGIRASMNMELMKFGKTSKDIQLSLWDNILDEELIDESQRSRVDIFGIDVGVTENRAIFALQKLFDKRNYRGNVAQIKRRDVSIPVISFAITDSVDLLTILT